MPRLLARWLGLPATGGGARPPGEALEEDVEEADWWVAMTVGKTKEGSALPANLIGLADARDDGGVSREAVGCEGRQQRR